MCLRTHFYMSHGTFFLPNILDHEPSARFEPKHLSLIRLIMYRYFNNLTTAP